MITAKVQDTAAGRWTVLQCRQHPEWTRMLGPFTDPAQLADDITAHEEEEHGS